MENYIINASIDSDKLRSYVFSSEVKKDDKIVVSIEGSIFLATVISWRKQYDKEDISIYDTVLRIATPLDLSNYKDNLHRELESLKAVKEEVNNLNLKMSVFRVTYTLDLSKIIILYTADERVDFRELLRSISSRLHTKLELRQVGPRDRSRLVGGVGPCGLKLCCSSFLSSFEGVSINMAKNQMLTLNIPKLSGQCGKLMCCLKYEDVAYASARRTFPNFGDKIRIDNNDLQVSGMNILNNTITVSNKETRVVLSKADYYKIKEKSDVSKKK